jgi:hypothetical protein
MRSELPFLILTIGYTLREAVNCADTSWNIEKYSNCGDRCLPSANPRCMMEFLSDSEIQRQPESSDDKTEEGGTTRDGGSMKGGLSKGPTKGGKKGSLKRKLANTELPECATKLNCGLLIDGLADSEIQQIAGLFGQTASAHIPAWIQPIS